MHEKPACFDRVPGVDAPSLGKLSEVLAASGKILKIEAVDYRRNVMAEMRWTNEWVREAEGPNREFLFLLEKR